jgi:hypothetical protein
MAGWGQVQNREAAVAKHQSRFVVTPDAYTVRTAMRNRIAHRFCYLLHIGTSNTRLPGESDQSAPNQFSPRC